MDIFHKLGHASKVLIVSLGLFLMSLTIGGLFFGHNQGIDQELLDHARESVRADMLYIHMDEGH